jgi:PadR family transcriptional regulator PadR
LLPTVDLLVSLGGGPATANSSEPFNVQWYDSLTTICEGNTGHHMNFLQGTLDLLILQALSARPLHGYDVVAWIRTTTKDTLRIDDGALYTSLHRMEKRGWLEPKWRVSPKGRRAKYYQLTAEGRKQMRTGERSWTRFAGAVAKVFAAR